MTTLPSVNKLSRITGLRVLAAFILLVAVIATALRFAPSASSHSIEHNAPEPPDAATQTRVREAYGQLPLQFEANAGQTDNRVRFLARGSRATLFLTPAAAVLQLRNAERADVLRIKPVNANPAPVVTGLNESPGRHHYFIGNDARRWRTNVATYGKVKYEAVYPGIDLVFYGRQQQLEYDFIVAPGADPRRIRLEFEGAQAARIDGDGNLVLRTASGEVRQHPPVVYQETEGGRQVIAARYKLLPHRNGRKPQVGFTLGAYDRGRTLWIDPVLEYSTYLGGAGQDQGLAIAVDRDGNTYVAGLTDSAGFPGSGPIQSVKGSVTDAFVAKINPAGSAIVFGTYLGGNSTDTALALALDAAGGIYLAGRTFSTDFPVTTGAAQRANAGLQDSFIAKIAPSGSSLVYSTLVGGNNADTVLALAADAAGNAYFAGVTDSTEFPAVRPPNARGGNPLHKSANRGDAWTRGGAGLTASLINGLTVDPTNPNTLYAATNYGVFKSTDAGATWRRTGTQFFAYSVAVDPVTPATIYVGTSSAVLKSTNGGESFENVTNGFEFGFTVAYTIAVDPQTPATVYAGTFRGAYKSVNGGGTWTPAFNGMSQTISSAPRINRLVIDPANPMTLYAATTNSVFKSTNGGGLWAVANTGLSTSQFVEITSLVIDPSSPGTLYAGVAGFAGSLYKTTNGGASWSRGGAGISYQFNGNTIAIGVNNLAIDPRAPATIYASSNSGGLFRSTDGGASWNLTRNGLTNQIISALAVDSAGAAYAGANIGNDGFAGKLNADGSAFGYLRYLGGTESDEARGIAVDVNGNAAVIGSTFSGDMPVTANALQPGNAGFSDYVLTSDVFVAKLNAAGTELTYSSYLGGNSSDQGRAIVLDATGNAYLAGITASTTFPTANAYRSIKSDFGFDVFVAKLNAAGAALEYSTYLGGTGEDLAAGLAVDAAGNAYITGTTASLDFPAAGTLQPPNSVAFQNRDLFLSKLSPNGSVLSFSTYLGGSRDELAGGIVVDDKRNVYLTGATLSFDFPTLNPLRSFLQSTEGFLVKLGARADLAVSGAALPNPVLANNRLSYTINVTNRGPDEATDVMLTGLLPAGITNVSTTTNIGSCTGTETVKCSLGELAAGASVTITIAASAPATGTLRNAATVASTTPDPVATNNSASQEARVSTLPNIAGRVTLAGGAPLASAMISLTGGQTAAKQSDGFGAFQFAELAAGGNYTVAAARPGFAVRPQMLTFNDLRADQTANFSAVACAFSIAPGNRSFAASGGTASVTVTANDALCPWTARGNAPWITVSSGGGGVGNGTLSYTVAPATAPRTGTMTIGGRTFTVQQEFEPCGAPAFRHGRGTPLPFSPSELASGDFNGDGQPDVAVRDGFGTIWFMAGDGKGSFGAPARVETAIAPPNQPRAMATGDFNADGRDDLALVSGETPGTITILQGAATGGFGAPRTVNGGARPVAVTTGNFNADTRLDLALLNNASDMVTILPGNGDGSFGAAINSPSTGFQNAFFTGDFNNDRNEDVVVIGSSSTSLLLGDGTGRFAAPRTVLSTSSIRLGAAGDFDRDGRLDLVFSLSQNFSSLTADVAFLRGNGAGGFETSRNFPAGPSASRVLAGDFNNDGLPDLVTANDSTDNISLLLGTGAGAFRAPVYFAAGAFFSAGSRGNYVVARDLNRDGNPDLAALVLNGASTSLPAQVAVLLGTGADFIAARDTLLANTPSTLALGDFNADGRQDLAVAQGETIVTRPGNAFGGFDAPATLNVPAQDALEARDLNGDGRIDLIARGSQRLTILLGNGTGGFTPGPSLAIGASARSAAVEDFDRDGRPDVVTLNSANQPAIFLGASAGGFGAQSVFGAGMNLNQFAAGDFNGDGHADVAASIFVSCGFGTVTVMLFPGDGTGGFGPPIRSYLGAPPQTLLTGDFNGDGRTDLATATGCFSSSVLSIAFGSADGSFTQAASYTFENGIARLASGDLNSDGRADLAAVVGDTFSTSAGHNIFALLGSEAGGYSAPVNLGTAGKAINAAIGDVNGDGRADIVAGSPVVSFNVAKVSTLLNACLGGRALAHLSAASFSGAQFARDSIVAVFGQNLATVTLRAESLPLPTQLAGTTVKVTDSAGVERMARIYFVSPSQVNYLVPAATLPGGATVTITSGSGAISTGTIKVATVAPGLFAANADGSGVAAALVLRVRTDGSQVYEPVARFDAALGRYVSVPIDLGPEGEQVFLVGYGTGFRFRSALSAVTLRIGGVDAPVVFAGAVEGLAGLDQLNARLPRSLAGRGEVDVVLSVDGIVANTVRLNFR